MNTKTLGIATTIKATFLDSLSTENVVSVFLCGGNAATEATFRRQLGHKISKIRSKYQYSVYYPEDMFIELILGHQRKDLMSLENLLATGVHCVVILLQSPGTFTELGAFTNFEDLKDKLIVVVDPKYRLKRSFVSLGPIRYLQNHTKSKVIYSEMEYGNIDTLVKHISEASREIARHSQPVNNLSNPISSKKFFLAMIYVFDPIQKVEIIEFTRKLSIDDNNTVVTIAESVLNGLVNERKALSIADTLSITQKGIDALIYDSALKRKSRLLMSLLSDLRLEALNLTLRTKFTRSGGAIVA